VAGHDDQPSKLNIYFQENMTKLNQSLAFFGQTLTGNWPLFPAMKFNSAVTLIVYMRF
jgi:hypothetical protein